jgi:stress response protein YsnF
MITRDQIPQIVGHPVHDAQGKKIGDAQHMYLDDATGDPEWVTVKTGLFGNNETFVPTRAARIVQDHLEVPYEKDQVKGAPNVDVDSGGHLSADEERHLYRYYGLESRSGMPEGERSRESAADAGGAGGGTGGEAAAAGGAAGAAGGMAAAGGRGREAEMSGETSRSAAGEDAAAKSAGTQEEAVAGGAAFATGQTAETERAAGAAEAMTRSEEEMHVRLERQASGRARLRKFVDVEEVEQTVPIRHEEVRLERESISDADRASRAGEISEAEQYVTLHEDRPVVETEVVPKERVRMRVEEHVEERTVHGRVRRERIEQEMTGSDEAAQKGTSELGDQSGDKRFG